MVRIVAHIFIGQSDFMAWVDSEKRRRRQRRCRLGYRRAFLWHAPVDDGEESMTRYGPGLDLSPGFNNVAATKRSSAGNPS